MRLLAITTCFAFLSGGSFHPKFKIGDCIAQKVDVEDSPESWEPSKKIKVIKILEIGKRSYNAVIDYGIFLDSADLVTYSLKFEADDVFVQVECTDSLKNYQYSKKN